MSDPKKEYIGFIEGFNARNLASLQETLEFKIEEIIDQLADISAKCENDSDVVKSVARIKKVLASKGNEDIDLTNRLFTTGELLKSSLTNFKKADSNKTRKIVLSLGQIAKLTDDKKLKEQAVDLGNQFLG